MNNEKETKMEEKIVKKEAIDQTTDEQVEALNQTDRTDDEEEKTMDSEVLNEETSSNEESSVEEVERFKAKIAQLEKELEEKENRLLRVQADFDNYRKRTKSEIELMKKYRSQSLATELLTALDNFERALQTEVTSEDGKALLQGVEMVYRHILEVFKNEGIEQIEAVGKEFNPEEHHAVMQGNDDQYDSNIVIEEFQKGYKLKDRVIRPSMVKVNQ